MDGHVGTIALEDAMNVYADARPASKLRAIKKMKYFFKILTG